MQCPHCHHSNVKGSAVCEECHADLTSHERHHGDVQAASSHARLLHVPVRELRLPAAPAVDCRATLAAAVVLMKERRANALVVTRAGKLAGILTSHDIVTRALGKAEDPGKTAVEAVMTPEPDFLYLDDKLSYAFHKMTIGGYRHVPVFDPESGFLGLISAGDLLQYIERGAGEV